MNKKTREELAELMKKYGKKMIPNHKDVQSGNVYLWDTWGDEFYVWLDTQKHSLNMEELFELFMKFRERLEIEGKDDDPYDEWWCEDRYAWTGLSKKFIQFCVGR